MASRSLLRCWGEVVESYNKTTPPLRRRNQKQCKDRWHKLNSTQVLCGGQQRGISRTIYSYGGLENLPRGVKVKTYNEQLRNARKRKAFHLERGSQEREEASDEMPQRPMGQKAAKKAALAAKDMGSDESGNSKESAIDLDKIGRYSKFQEETNEKRMKILEVQQKLSTEKLEATKIAHLTAQENKEGKKLEKESKMMEALNNLISQDTSTMSNEEKAERVAVMKCLRKALFPSYE